MNEGSSIHQLESTKDIVCIFVDGIFLGKINFECILSNYEFDLVGSVYINKNFTSLPLDIMHVCNSSNEWV